MYLSLLLASALTGLATAQMCYFRDGSMATEDSPCEGATDQQYGMCCGPQNLCFSNGLCFDPSTFTANRGSCTDPAWTDAGCVDLCPNQLYAGLFACGSLNMSCTPDDCSNTFSVLSGRLVGNDALQSYINNVATTSDSSNPTSTFTLSSGSATTQASTSTATDQSTCPDNDGVSIGTAIGAGIGSAVGILLITALAWFLLRKKLSGKASSSSAAVRSGHNMHMQSPSNQHQMKSSSGGFGTTAPTELPGTQNY